MDLIEWSSTQAVLFDLDGVLTPTAEVHERAWTDMFDEFLMDTPRIGDPSPFTEADYLAYVDGRPRYDGVRAFLASRTIDAARGPAGRRAGRAPCARSATARTQLFNEILAA